MNNCIGVLYVGLDAYVNEKFTLFPGQAVIVDKGLGHKLVETFPDWFELFDGAEEILNEGIVGLNTPYNYMNQGADFENAIKEDEELSEDDSDGTDVQHSEVTETSESEETEPAKIEATEDELAEAEVAEPQNPEEQALEDAVNDHVAELETDAVLKALAEKPIGTNN